MDNNELISTYIKLDQPGSELIQFDESGMETTKNQLRVFLVAQARRELERVIKLTLTLDKLQDKYQEKIEEYLENHDTEEAVVYLPIMIDTITKCINRSNDIISKVVGDDKIMNFQFISNDNKTINIDNSGTNNPMQINLEDPASRMKVREAVNAVLQMMKDDQNNN